MSWVSDVRSTIKAAITLANSFYSTPDGRLPAVCVSQERKLQQQAEDWDRYLSCTPLPDVRDAARTHAYFAEAAVREHKDLASILHTCQVTDTSLAATVVASVS